MPSRTNPEDLEDGIQAEHDPLAPEPQVDQAEVFPEEAPSLEVAFQWLREANGLPEQTQTEKLRKKEILEHAQKIVFTMQQGQPLLHLTADHIAKAHPQSSSDLRMNRLRLKARTDQDIAWLVSQNTELAELAKRPKKNTKKSAE